MSVFGMITGGLGIIAFALTLMHLFKMNKGYYRIIGIVLSISLFLLLLSFVSSIQQAITKGVLMHHNQELVVKNGKVTKP